MGKKRHEPLTTPEGEAAVVETHTPAPDEEIRLPTHRDNPGAMSPRMARPPRDAERNRLKEAPDQDQDEKLQAALNALSELGSDEHRALADMGYTVPIVQSGTSIHDAKKIRLGYQCRECHQPGLYFVGDKFMTPEGDVSELPPLTLHISRIPWSQPHLPPESVMRSNPYCQFCHSELRLTGDGRLQHRLVVNIEQWFAQRQAAWQQMAEIKAPGGDPAGTRDKAPMPNSLYDVMEPRYVHALKRIAEHVHLGELAFGKEGGRR